MRSFRLKYEEKRRYFIIALFLMFLLGGCRSTKFVPQDEYLLNKVDVRLDNKEIDKEELESYIRQKHNVKVLGLWKVRLGIYNLSSRKKDDGWLKKIGEPPVVYDAFMKNRSLENIKGYLRNKGYYQGEVFGEIKKNDRKKKLNITYHVHSNAPYKIAEIDFNIKDETIKDHVLEYKGKSNVKTGDLLDVDELDKERERFTRGMKNIGYYAFSKDFIEVHADSANRNKTANINWIVSGRKDKSGKQLSHEKYAIRKLLVYPDYDPPKALADESYRHAKFDTTKIGETYFLYHGKKRINPEALVNPIQIVPGELYRLRNVEKTYNSLSAIKQFRFINIQFNELNEKDSLGNQLLDCVIQLSPQMRQSYSFDIEGTNSSGNFGVAGNFKYQHRNLFKGAEVFGLSLRGAVEDQQAVVNSVQENFNSEEYGIESEIQIPKFWAPIRGDKLFNYSVPLTRFNLSFNYQKRPDYTRTIANAKFGYRWKSSNLETHNINLLDFNLVHLYQYNEEFLEKIKDLNILSSYTDHMIFALNYTYTYNTQNLKRRSDYTYFRYSIESAGNTLYALNNWFGSKKHEIEGSPVSSYKLLDTPYSQYIKSDIEYRHGFVLDDINTIVVRAFAGVGIPYGNNNAMPFEKMYFTGGANGIRAWSVRSLGPGSYKAEEGSFPNQTSDMKLEANVEYRFKLFWKLEGALFLDAGNIWSVDQNDTREGAVFKLDRFYKEIALGTGIGTRFNLSYFVARFDIGLKIRDPGAMDGNRLIIGNRKFKSDDLNFSIAIGYPF
ncbi:outer membrane protein assembly factor [Puteibacter caeruleilacunae]|nr:outer membrane protein assembly factor [Puteibacter caeruleilacunae]